jgi:hypothetical protein
MKCFDCYLPGCSTSSWTEEGLLESETALLQDFSSRQARTGDTMLVKSREMTGTSQTLSWWLVGGGVKTTENKIQYTGPLD